MLAKRLHYSPSESKGATVEVTGGSDFNHRFIADDRSNYVLGHDGIPEIVRDMEMKKPVPSNSMSPVDAAFLYLERKEIPLHIASVCVFDGPIPFQEFVASINAKLHLVPRYTQIPVIPAWSLGFPTWEEDPRFDIRRHIFQVRLEAPGGEAELQALAGRIFSEVMDRSKPLWDMHLVDGLKDGRGAIILRVHHALADGIAGMELMKVMFDSTPGVDYSTSLPRPRPRRRKATQHSLAEEVLNTLNSTLGGLFAFEAGLLGFAETLLRGKSQSDVKGLLNVLPEFAASVERLPFNKPCTGERKFCWTEFSINDVQAVREAAGGTVNDVILAVIAGALRVLLASRGEELGLVTASVPVSVRRVATGGQLGNQVGVMPLALPAGSDLAARVARIAAITRQRKTAARGTSAALLGPVFRLLAPTGVLRWFFNRQRLIHTVATNLHGPAQPLTFAGAPVRAVIPVPNTTGNVTISFGALSYAGTLQITVLSDPSRAPDVSVLTGALRRELGSAAR